MFEFIIRNFACRVSYFKFKHYYCLFKIKLITIGINRIFILHYFKEIQKNNLKNGTNGVNGVHSINGTNRVHLTNGNTEPQPTVVPAAVPTTMKSTNNRVLQFAFYNYWFIFYFLLAI